MGESISFLKIPNFYYPNMVYYRKTLIRITSMESTALTIYEALLAVIALVAFIYYTTVKPQ
jgi:hypothetical protein